MKWISVKDKLPEKPIDVLVCGNKYGELANGKWQAVLCFVGGVWVENEDDRVDWTGHKPTHWMPLPEPPKR